MSKTKVAAPEPRPRQKRSRESRAAASKLVLSTGCPAGIGPEICLRVASQLERAPVLVGNPATLRQAAELVGVPQRRLVAFRGVPELPGQIPILAAGPTLTARDRRPAKPSKLAGQAQLAYINTAYRLAKEPGFRGLVTAPVNKAAVYDSGAPGARRFIGHTEWLEKLDDAPLSVMCFWSSRLVCALVTTHLPLRSVPQRVSAGAVEVATVSLARLLRRLGSLRPRVAVCSLNPHASEAGLFGDEEQRAIVPGLERARALLGRRALVSGPVGAETAFRRAYAGAFDGVVAMYHDQATIPMKLVAFGEAVNVTLGLSIDRTSVDHGTAYDIAWQGVADPTGLRSAVALAERLALTARA